jgi:hypothetical protein
LFMLLIFHACINKVSHNPGSWRLDFLRVVVAHTVLFLLYFSIGVVSICGYHCCKF